MTTDDIIKKAKERLAELDAERAKLQAIIAAAEGKPLALLPAPNPMPFIPIAPQPMPSLPYRQPWEIERRWDVGEVYCSSLMIPATDSWVSFH